MPNFTCNLTPAPCNMAPPAARHYHPTLSIWLSVDPMSDKYPSTSPYAYCGDNPVRLVDEDGREIWVVGEDGKKYQYKNGALYDKGGIEFQARKNSYEAKVLNNLNVLAASKDEKIKNRLNDLVTSGHTHTICSKRGITRNFAKPDNIMDSYNPKKGSGSTVFFDPQHSFEYPDGADSYAPASLAHELLGHAWDYDQGKNRKDLTQNGIKYSEVNAVNIQNIILKEHGMNTRSQYGVKQGDNTIKWLTIPENLLNKYFTE